MRYFLIALMAFAQTLQGQTFNRTYGEAFPFEENTGAYTLEHEGSLLLAQRVRHLNTVDAYLRFTAMDENGEVLVITDLLDTLHPFAVQGSTFTSAQLYVSTGLKQNYGPLPYSHAFTAAHYQNGDMAWYSEYANSDDYFNFLN